MNSHRKRIFFKSIDKKKYNIYFNNKCNWINSEIPNLFLSDNSQITDLQEQFYHDINFPNYDDFDDFSSLLNKGKSKLFSSLLDDELPYNGTILELGCGTGQLSIFLSRYNRLIFGSDISTGSLKIGENFRKKSNINNVFFSKMNVFNLMFKENFFDVIISNGVLHHTKNPKLAYKNLLKCLKKNGYIIIGLYHKYGRIFTNLKQIIAPYFQKNFFLFDKTLRNMRNNKRKKAWFKDQFLNPHETKHTFREILDWFRENNVEFVNSIPFTYTHKSNLLSKEKIPQNWDLIFKELILSLNRTQIQEGGFFIMIGKKLK